MAKDQKGHGSNGRDVKPSPAINARGDTFKPRPKPTERERADSLGKMFTRSQKEMRLVKGSGAPKPPLPAKGEPSGDAVRAAHKAAEASGDKDHAKLVQAHDKAREEYLAFKQKGREGSKAGLAAFDKFIAAGRAREASALKHQGPSDD